MRIAAAVLVAALVIVGTAPTALADDRVPKSFVEVWGEDAEALARELAAKGYDVTGVDRAAGLVGVVATDPELEALRETGLPLLVRSRNDEAAIQALSDYMDPAEVGAFLDQMVATYPTLVRKVILRDTLFEGHVQAALHITKDVSQPNERPAFILDAQHHAREVMTPEIARDMVEYLLGRYATDPEVQRWVDSLNIWVVVSVNPDGANKVFTVDNMWRKNAHPSCPVDINRNYPFAWGSCNGSSGVCSDATFRGDYPGSEPETLGNVQLTSDVHPVYVLSYHTYGEYILFPYGCSNSDENATYTEIGQALNAVLENDNGVTGQYATGPSWSTIYLVDGGSIDTQYATYGAFSFVIEANREFQPDYATRRNVTVQRQRVAWKFFLNRTLDGPQVRGKVTDRVTGLPLAAYTALQEVTFTHGESPRKADANGNYHVVVRPNMTWHVAYSFPGYCSQTLAVAVGPGPADQDVQLVKADPPGGPAAAPAGDNAIDVTWAEVPFATEYRLYRSLTPGGPYTLLATVPAPATSYHDAPVSGGVTYYYTVKSYAGCESSASAEASATATGPCTLGPSFTGVGAVNNPVLDTCTLNLSWSPAVGRCGGEVTYRVYRHTAPFTPGPAYLIAAALTGTGYTDHGGLQSRTNYYYIVRAVDAANGLDDGNTVSKVGLPTAPSYVGTWTDDAGDTGSARMSISTPWSIKTTGGLTGPRVYSTGSYAANLCSPLTSPPLALAPGTTPVLSFASKYDLETNYDAGVVEVAVGPSYATWTRLATVNYPDGLANGGNACALPASGAGTVFSRTQTPAYPAQLYVGSLADYAGKDVKFRFRLSSNAATGGQGWWIDDISVTNVVLAGTCTPGAVPDPMEASWTDAMTAGRGAGTAVNVSYMAPCGITEHAAYWGQGPIAGALQWTGAACGLGNIGTATFDPGDPPAGSFYYFVVVGQSGTKEGSYGQGYDGVGFPERPEATGIGTCDRPQVLNGACP